jgi:hypothetical protein
LTQPSQQAVQLPHCREAAPGATPATGCNAITAPQHFLYFLPLPHGQGSFLPTAIAEV